MATEASFAEEVREMARARVREGFAGPGEIVERIADILADEHEVDALEEAVAAAVDQAIAEHLRDQASWPLPTDCDRLDRAFDCLEESGILARQNYWCCQTCGSAAIHDELDKAGETARGYVYYHEQDTEGAAEGGSLYLAYGAAGQATQEEMVAIADEIAASIREVGLGVAWNRDVNRRMLVELEWRRRRTQDGEPVLPTSAVHEG
jgi:hypothetical protein